MCNRAGYSDDLDTWALIRWRGAVKSAIKGRRGQAFLKELLETLDSMEKKELIVGELVTPEGQVCALGSIFKKRNLDVIGLDSEDHEYIADQLNISEALTREIAYENDERVGQTPEQRFESMRSWIKSLIA